jgi:O-acetyl-ADP-ribose deacetylase (regulator of RNase III)
MAHKFEIIKANLIDLAKSGEYDMIAQGCNCFCTMNSGVAKDIRENFPSAFEADKQTIKGDIRKLGTYTVGKVYKYKTEILKVINCYTQFNYGRNKDILYANYAAIELCMLKINAKYPNSKIALPMIGCGLANGDWTIVERIIREKLIDLDVTICYL